MDPIDNYQSSEMERSHAGDALCAIMKVTPWEYPENETEVQYVNNKYGPLFLAILEDWRPHYQLLTRAEMRFPGSKIPAKLFESYECGGRTLYILAERWRNRVSLLSRVPGLRERFSYQNQ